MTVSSSSLKAELKNDFFFYEYMTMYVKIGDYLYIINNLVVLYMVVLWLVLYVIFTVSPSKILL